MTVLIDPPFIGRKKTELNNATLPLSGSEILGAVQSALDVKLTTQDIANIVISLLGTAASQDTGITDGTIPLISTGDKLDNGLLNTATELQAGIAQIATNLEVFNKNADKILTASALANDVRLNSYSVNNSVSSLAQVIAPGANYNLLTSFLEVNEAQAGNLVIVYKDINNLTQNTYLDEANNKFLFPSNLYTYNLDKVPFTIRITLVYDSSALSSSQSNALNVSIKRVVDNSAIFSEDFALSNQPAKTGAVRTFISKTFVNGESDAFVLDGCYVDITSESTSQNSITLQSVSIRIFREL